MIGYPTLTALRAASQSRIERTVKARSPRIALICLARRRCDVILAVLRTVQLYQGTRKEQHTGGLADAA